MRQAGFSLTASPLASCAASRLLRQESTPGTRIPLSYADSARSCLFSPSLWYHGVYHVNRPISIHLNSYLAARLGGMQQKILSWGSAMNNTFLLFYSPKPGGQVWTIVHIYTDGFFQILLKYSYLVTAVVITVSACLHGGGVPQIVEVTRLGGVTRLSL